MKVCLLSASVHPTGGVAAMVRALGNGLAGSGHEVLVVHCDGNTSPPPGFDASVRFRRIHDATARAYSRRDSRGGAYRLYWRLLSLRNIALVRELTDLIGEFSPDIVHTHETRGFPLRLWQELRRCSPGGIVHTCHDIELLSPVHSASLDARNPLTTFALRRWSALYRNPSAAVDVLITPSRFMHARLAEAGLFRTARSAVIANVPDLPGARPAEILTAPNAEAPLKIAFLGRLVELKGVIPLCAVAARLAGKGHRIELRIAGDGPLRGAVERTCEAHPFMSYLGEVRGSAKRELLHWSHLVAMPSVGAESFGLVAVEAFAAARPVLASNRGGLPEVVADGRTGWICQAGEGGLERGLRRVLDDRAELPGFSSRSQAEAQQFRLSKYIALHEAAYHGSAARD